MSEEKTIEQLIAELRDARTNLERATEEEKLADHRVTDARNVYNGICKRVDASIQKLKEGAPWNTEWHSQLHPGRAIGGGS
jgi:hypothetical protein